MRRYRHTAPCDEASVGSDAGRFEEPNPGPATEKALVKRSFFCIVGERFDTYAGDTGEKTKDKK